MPIKKICSNCGMMKKTMFHCKRCGKTVGLCCYNFVFNVCSNCETLNYAERYAEMIKAYEDGERCLN